MKKILASAALKNSKSNHFSKWGRGAGENSATLRLETSVTVPQDNISVNIKKNAKVFTIGSCFARNIESALQSESIEVLSRNIDIPFDCPGPRAIDTLNKYNPATIYHELEWALGNSNFNIESFQMLDGKYTDLNLKPKTPPQSINVAENFRNNVTQYFQQIKNCDC